jgi:hypothetical protein
MLAMAALKINSLEGEQCALRMQSYPSSPTATNHSVRDVASPQVRILVDQGRCVPYNSYKTRKATIPRHGEAVSAGPPLSVIDVVPGIWRLGFDTPLVA